MSRFRLVAGAQGPTQQSPTTCGAAALTVARMLLDPAFAGRIAGSVADAAGVASRFARAERDVTARTNAWMVRGRGLWRDLPWPRALGTSPWGALTELERGTGRRYRIVMLRHLPAAAILPAIRRAPAPDAPALLYVGSPWLPRHVVLVASTGEGAGAVVYEPSRGVVADVGGPVLGTPVWGGWTRAWWLIQAASDSGAA